MALPEGIHARIVDETTEWARRFIKAFHAEDGADALLEVISKRGDHNAAPEQPVIASRKDFTEAASSDRAAPGEITQDFSD